MPCVPKEYKYIASTSQQLFQQIANDDNIRWLSPYGLLTLESILYFMYFMYFMDPEY